MIAPNGLSFTDLLQHSALDKSVQCKTEDGAGLDQSQRQHSYTCKSFQTPVLRQAIGPLLNQTGQAATARDLIFLQINSDKRK